LPEHPVRKESPRQQHIETTTVHTFTSRSVYRRRDLTMTSGDSWPAARSGPRVKYASPAPAGIGVKDDPDGQP
jgi:hypothetical protein